MSRCIVALAGLLWFGTACADRLYADSFERPVIDPLFPRVGGIFQLPPGPTTDQLSWILGELAPGETTTPEEIAAHFDSSWTVSVPDTQAFFASLRATFPDAIVRDVVTVTPVTVTVVIAKPDDSTPYGYVQLGARYTGTRGIDQFGVSNYFGSVQYPEDQNLTLDEAVSKFGTLSANPALLIGRIGANGQCSTLVGLDADQLRATGSIFKLWVLGGVARAITNGTLPVDEEIPLVASELALAGSINVEPLGTLFPLIDMATLMIGISDNTATDHLHERVGRDLIGQVINDYGVAQPLVLTPLLGISEQFSLYYSFPLATALDYVNGSEAFQQQFLEQQIEPLGPVMGGPYANTEILTAGTWRATPLDICAAFAHLRRLPQGSDAIGLADRALGASAAQPEVRNAWDRVWSKGGSLSSAAGFHVLTHAWMLQDTGEDPYVVIAMANSDAGGIDQYKVQSVTGRMLQLLAQKP